MRAVSVSELVTLPTLQVAPMLLGWYLVHEEGDVRVSGRIVETEAYLQDDPAAHSFRGETKRNRTLFGAPGHAYVYLSYGIHLCMNVATAPVGTGEGVLIRAITPEMGSEYMAKCRSMLPTMAQFANGPGKVTQALGISLADDGRALDRPPLYLCPGDWKPDEMMITTPRIGISQGKEAPYRFLLRER